MARFKFDDLKNSSIRLVDSPEGNYFTQEHTNGTYVPFVVDGVHNMEELLTYIRSSSIVADQLRYFDRNGTTKRIQYARA